MNRLLSFDGAGVGLTASAWGNPSAPPILFLHAACQSRTAWEAAAQMVAQRNCLGIALDLRGHGDSGWAPDGDYTRKAFASDVVAVIDRLDRPVTIVGTSLGGWTALAAAAQRPARVGLALSFDAAPTMVQLGREKFYDFVGLATEGFASVEQAAQALEARFGRTIANIDRFRAKFTERNGRLFFRWDPKIANLSIAEEPGDAKWLLGLLQGFERPMALMLAEHDSLVSRDAILELRAVVPQLVVERWQGMRHGMTTRDSLRIAARALFHLERLAGPVGES